MHVLLLSSGEQKLCRVPLIVFRTSCGPLNLGVSENTIKIVFHYIEWSTASVVTDLQSTILNLRHFIRERGEQNTLKGNPGRQCYFVQILNGFSSRLSLQFLRILWPQWLQSTLLHVGYLPSYRSKWPLKKIFKDGTFLKFYSHQIVPFNFKS